MSIELIIAIVIVAALGIILASNYKKGATGVDVNKDGRVDLEDAKTALENTVSVVKETADVNKDGQVNVEDVKAGAAEIAETVKKTAARVRKPRAKKSST